MTSLRLLVCVVAMVGCKRSASNNGDGAVEAGIASDSAYEDLDGDGIPDIDEGRFDNPSRDTDGDGVPDAKDLDSDDDGLTDAE